MPLGEGEPLATMGRWGKCWTRVARETWSGGVLERWERVREWTVKKSGRPVGCVRRVVMKAMV